MTDETESSRPQQASEFDASLETDSEGPAHRLLALLESEYDSLLRCGSAWKRDPGNGVIGVEKGPLIPVV
jgi:hypothetical protein